MNLLRRALSMFRSARVYGLTALMLVACSLRAHPQSTFCDDALPHNTGGPAILSASGTVLTCVDLPRFNHALLAVSPITTQPFPFGPENGLLCLNPLYRDPHTFQTTGDPGVVVVDVGPSLVTRNFQVWYRDCGRASPALCGDYNFSTGITLPPSAP